MGLGDKLKGLGGAGQKPPDTPLKCEIPKKHWVGVRLRHKDDKSDVVIASCNIHQGASILNGGPLIMGTLESTCIDAAKYEVSFPDIHADEWSAE